MQFGKKIQKAINIALQEAEKNNNKFRLAAVTLDRRGRVLAASHNEMLWTHPIQKKWAARAGKPHSEYLHAEIAALLKSRSKVYSLIVVRLYRNGKLALAKPCRICDLGIEIYGVKNVIYSNSYSDYTWEKR